MMKKLFILSTLILTTFLSHAQPGKEAWNWIFGFHGKIDFSTGTAVTGTITPYGLYESCATISDKNTGQLLFWGTPNAAFNKNNLGMPNGYGLKGNTAVDNGALIVPKPGSSTLFYYFTGDITYTNNLGIHYHVIDMTASGGLGSVILKNQVLTPGTTTERITAVRHCNGRDYWIITHPFYSNNFNVYLLDTSGINLTPIVSSVGPVENCLSSVVVSGYNNCSEGGGYLKASPNGKKLAMASTSDSLPIVGLFDFDNFTGIVSNPLTIQYPGSSGPYGLSFSPDNTKLYTAPFLHDTINTIFQYDVSINIPLVILGSQTLIAQQNAKALVGLACAMQMAPDGKIYIARYGVDTLAVISNPNNAGSACNFQWGGLPMAPGSHSFAGLPYFIDANYAGIQIHIQNIHQCNTFTTTTLDAGAGFTNYLWNTGATTQTITVNNPGKYWVTVSNNQGCTRTDTVNAYLEVPSTTTLIACDTFHANITQDGVFQYTWFDTNHNPIRDFTQTGNYYVDKEYTSGCTIRDSLKVTVITSPKINLGNDTTFCKGNLLLKGVDTTLMYQWNTGSNAPSITTNGFGTYWVIIKDVYGCQGGDSIILKPKLEELNFVMPNIVTPNDDKINDVIDFGVYQFSSLQIDIYNRWGTHIFESNDINAIWKPTENDGIYFYTAQYKIDCGSNSDTKKIKGFITIVR